jgi:MerR family transcriptional regulator, heat shock protein HspR
MARRSRKTRGKAGYMISAVAEMYSVHPQTLRLYEREGLLIPSRSVGNTRLYTQEDLDRLEAILNLTRDLGVNLAGVEIVLNMRDRMGEMQREMRAFVEFVRKEMMSRTEETSERIQNALVRVGPPALTRTRNSK